MQPKKLFRSKREKMIAGVCGGLAEYFNIDTTLVRLLFVVLLLTPFHGLIVYLILWLITPVEPQDLPA
jgi:phage shock protein C